MLAIKAYMHLADVHNWIGLYISEKKKKYRNLGKVMIPDISVQLRSPILRTGFVQSMIPDIYKTAVIYNSCIPLIWKLYLLVTCDSIPNSCTSIKLHCIYIFTDVIFCLFVQAQFPPIILQYDAAYELHSCANKTTIRSIRLSCWHLRWKF